jgi:hypothetical protein
MENEDAGKSGPAMQDINYDLVKLLQQKLSTAWQLEHFCVKDAETAQCHSLPALQEILKDEKRHAKMIADEIRMRVEAGKFN